MATQTDTQMEVVTVVVGDHLAAGILVAELVVTRCLILELA